MHTLLERQLRRFSLDEAPPTASWLAFLAAVSEAYKGFDEDRATIERSLELSSRELFAVNAEARAGSELLRAVLDSTVNGILAVGSDGHIIHTNRRFAELWRIPQDMVERGVEAEMLAFVLEQLADPQAFLAGVEELYAGEEEVLDTLVFKDGRIYERYSRPLRELDRVIGRVWSFRDITESRQAALAVEESERRFRALVQNSSDMILILNATGFPTYASPSIENIMGYTLDELRERGALSFVHPDDFARAAESLASVIDQPGSHPPTVVRIRHGDGSWRDLELVANNMLADPAIEGIVYNARDVTQQLSAQRLVQESEERFRSLVQNSSDLLSILDADHRVSYQSPSTGRILGITSEQVVGRPWRDVLHPDDVEIADAFLNELERSEGTVASVEVRVRHGDGSWRTIDVTGTNLFDVAAVSGLVLNGRDVTERKVLEEQMRHQAFHDSLTGLPNRALFSDRVSHALARARRTGRPASVLFIDVDNFKSINDAFGHSTGDEILVRIAERISHVLRPGDTAARFGGDEFTLLLEDMTTEEAKSVGERIVASLRVPFSVGERDVFVECSVGVASGGGDSQTVDSLLRDADAAMYIAKGRGKARVELYDKSMHMPLHDRLELLADIQQARELNQFVLQYQPTFELANGRLVGAEALVRWKHPERGMIPPLEFIPLAEDAGVIHPLGAWVLQEAVDQLSRWQEAYPQEPPLHVAVNVSGHQLEPSFVDDVRAVLAGSSIVPSQLVLEVTESVTMRDISSTIAVMKALKDLGVRLAIDDFGTGYSSLSYLRQFPFDILKIDKSFVDDAANRDGRELTSAIIEIGKLLHLELVAEGIERADQLDYLLSLRCDVGQGFYFARPMFAHDLSALLAQRQAEERAA